MSKAPPSTSRAKRKAPKATVEAPASAFRSLRDARRDDGAAGVRTAITEALKRHQSQDGTYPAGTGAAIARELDTTPQSLYKAAARVGIDLPEFTPGSPKGSPAHEARWRKPADKA